MNKAYVQTAFYFGTVFIGQGLGFLLLPIVTRFVSTEVFGQYTIALVVASFVTMIGSVWIRNLGFRLYYEAIEKKETKSYFFTYVFLQALIIFLGLGLLSFFINSIFKDPISLQLYLILSAYIVLADYYTLTVNLVRAEDKTIPFSLAEIGNAAVRFIVTVVALNLGFKTAEALVFAMAVSTIFPSIYATFELSKKLTGSLRINQDALKSLLRYGPASVAFPMSVWGEESADRILLERFKGNEVVGVYAAAYGLADKVVGAIELAVFRMAWPNILRAYTEKGVAAAKQVISESFKMHLWLSTGPAVFIAVYNQEFINLLGKDFQGGAIIMPFIVASAWLRGTRSYLDRHLELKKRFGVKAGITAIGAITNITLNIILIPRYGLVGAGIATMADFGLTWLISFAIRDTEFTQVPYQTLFTCLLLAGLAWFNSGFFSTDFLRLTSFIVIYALGFAVFILGPIAKRKLAGRKVA